MQMKEVQKEILENKRRHGFNSTDIAQAFCYLYGEVNEAYDAYCKGLSTFGEELADVNIFLMGIAEIIGIDLEVEIQKKKSKSNKTQCFNMTSMEQKFCDLYGEVNNAYDAYHRGLSNFGEELADVAIYLIGIAESRDVNLEKEVLRKVEINKNREYYRNELGYMIHK